MNLVQAQKAIEVEDKERNKLKREQRQTARNLLQHILDNLEGSGLRVVGPFDETEESLEVTLQIRDMPPEFIRLIAHDIGVLVLQRRTQFGVIARTESAKDEGEAMVALIRLAMG